LRFLAFKLELNEKQVSDLAAVLSELKTERAQASVDQRRTTTALADAVAGEVFDEAKAKGAADERIKSNERVQQAVASALSRIHALLEPEQRTRLAYLLRTGALSI
jgi:Spy/CpxP family protein refolding chaperone